MSRIERVILATALVLLLVVIGLGPLAAPCASWIDGPCHTNWASSAQWTVLPLVLFFCSASLMLIMRRSARRARQAFRQLGG